MGLGVSGSFDLGAFGRPQATVSLTGTTSEEVAVGAGTDQDVSVTQTLAKKNFVSELVVAGPVEFWVTPSISADATISGHVSAGLTSLGRSSQSLTISYVDGVLQTATSDTSSATGASTGSTASAAVKGSLTASGNVSFSLLPPSQLTADQPTAVVSIGAGPYGRLYADPCTIRVWAGLTLSASVSLEALGITFADASIGKNWESDPFALDWRNCAIWTGTVSYDGQRHTNDSPGLTNDTHASAALVIDPPAADGARPQDGIFPAHGSGSGANVTTDARPTCQGALGGDVFPYTAVDTDTWGGAITMAPAFGVPGDDPKVRVDLLFADADGEHYRLDFANGGIFPLAPTVAIPGSYHHSGLKSRLFDCVADEFGEDRPTYWFDVFYLGVAGQSARVLEFTLPPGATTASGTMHVPPGPLDYTLTWSLLKICSMGGTNC